MDNTTTYTPPSSWMQLTRVPGVTTREGAYLFLCLGITVYVVWYVWPKTVDNRPVLNPAGFEMFGFKRRLEFAETAGRLLDKGRQLFPEQPYHIITDTCDLLILPPRFADGIRNNPDLDFTESIAEEFHSHLPGFQPFSPGLEDDLSKVVVKKQLTKMLSTDHPTSLDMSIIANLNKPKDHITEPLSAETDFALQKRFGTGTEWKEFNFYDEILDVIARISIRVFLGPELCRNEAWLKITKNYTVDSFIAAYILRLFPKYLRSMVHWFLPQCRNIRAQLEDSKKLITPIVKARRELRQQMEGEGKSAPHFNDAIDWFDQEAKGQTFSEENCQLGLSMAAIHTTTDLLTETMQNVILHPQLLNDLRAEICQVLGAEGWKKSSLYNLKLVDSVIKESQRLGPASMTSMQRIAMRDTKLPDGSILRKGQRCAIYVNGPSGMLSSDNYKKPEEFDPHRFARMRGQPGLDAKAHLVSTGSAHLAFGHGQHSCPGRFFASNEIKVALCHMLMNYDWKYAPGFSPKRMKSGFTWGTDPQAKVLVRRRSDPEIDLLKLEV